MERRGEKGESRRSPEAVASELREARRGYMASANGEPRSANPFPDFTALARCWWAGYDAHQRGDALPSGEPPAEVAAPATVRPPPPPWEEPPAPPPARVSTSTPSPVSTPPEPRVSTPSARPTVRVPPEKAPYPRCPGCKRMGGAVCPTTCSHRQAREKGAQERVAPPPAPPPEEAGPPPPERPAMPPPPVEEEPAPSNVRPFRVLPGGGEAPDPHAEHRRFLVELLEETLALVKAGHVDAGFFVVHHSPTHPTGCGWATAFSGNVDFVHRLGALELAKADMLHRANGGGETK